MHDNCLRISGHRAAEIFVAFTEEHKGLGTNSRRAFLKSHVASRKRSRKQRSIARSDSSQKSLAALLGQLFIHLQHRYRKCVPAPTRSESTRRSARRDLSLEPTETETQIKNEATESARGDLLRDMPELLTEFTENLVDERVPAHRDAPASTSRDSDSEPPRKMVWRKDSIYTHFPKDRNCDIFKRTKITRAFLQKTYWYSRTQSGKF